MTLRRRPTTTLSPPRFVAVVKVEGGRRREPESLRNGLPLEPSVIAERADHLGALKCSGRVTAAIEVARGLEQAEELVEIECPSAASALERLTHAPAAGRVAVDPGRVLGLVEDLREHAKRLIDRFVSQSPNLPAVAWIDERLPRFCSCADPSVVLMDPPSILLDPLRRDL